VGTPALVLCGCLALIVPTWAWAQDQSKPIDAHVEISPQPPSPETKTSDSGALERDAEPIALQAPPERPRHKGVVLESTLGVLAFGGQFRHVAPPAYFMHGQLGYEPFSWLMIFGEGELAFTDTSESQSVADSRAFDLWGFGGGIRVSPRVGRFGLFAQAEAGALTAQVPHDALANLGFRGAESLGLELGGRAGVEWYQRDRHFALSLQGGPRLAQGFAKVRDSADLPLMWDVAAGLRYTF
jgi:hypothetical protein